MVCLQELLVLSLTMAAVGSVPPLGLAAISSAFEAFKGKHQRHYSTKAEEKFRFSNFRDSMERIAAHNANSHRTWTRGINQFSDLSEGEFKSTLMSEQTCSATHGKRAPLIGGEMLPVHVDWRERDGIVSEVKNQGKCGSCWTFSSTGCLEAHVALKYGSWHRSLLSEQQLVDCAQAFDNDGCRGGLPSHAFEYIRYAGGLDSELNYQYTALDGECTFNASASPPVSPFLPRSAGIGVQVPGGSINITVGDENALKFHLATTGPVSIAYQVAPDFRDYESGVYTSTLCNNTPQDVNHAVLAVGYGSDPDTGLDYWLVKNSWDYTFGQEGYFKIEAFKNMCGVADCMSYPDLYGDGKLHPVFPSPPVSAGCVGLFCRVELFMVAGVACTVFGFVLFGVGICTLCKKRLARSTALATSLQPLGQGS